MRHDFAPSWHVFVYEWWLQQAAIEWAAEPFLLAISFWYSRTYLEEEGACLEADRVKYVWNQVEGEAAPLQGTAAKKFKYEEYEKSGAILRKAASIEKDLADAQ